MAGRTEKKNNAVQGHLDISTGKTLHWWTDETKEKKSEVGFSERNNQSLDLNPAERHSGMMKRRHSHQIS